MGQAGTVGTYASALFGLTDSAVDRLRREVVYFCVGPTETYNVIMWGSLRDGGWRAISDKRGPHCPTHSVHPPRRAISHRPNTDR